MEQDSRGGETDRDSQQDRDGQRDFQRGTDRGCAAYRVVQPVDVQHHRLGPLVGGAQEELGLPPAGRRRCLRLLRLLLARRLQDLIDLRRQQLGLPWRRGPGGVEGDGGRMNIQNRYMVDASVKSCLLWGCRVSAVRRLVEVYWFK